MAVRKAKPKTKLDKERRFYAVAPAGDCSGNNVIGDGGGYTSVEALVKDISYCYMDELIQATNDDGEVFVCQVVGKLQKAGVEYKPL